MKTETGFEFEIAEGAEDDAELFDDLLELDEGNLRPSRRVARSILGEEGQKRLYEHCRGENGRVSLTKVYQEIADIINQANGKVKNS